MESARLAVVTGASSGTGLELARLFAADGYDLVVVADESEIDDTARDLADAGVHVESVRVDLRDDDAVERGEQKVVASSLTSKMTGAVSSVLRIRSKRWPTG